MGLVDPAPNVERRYGEEGGRAVRWPQLAFDVSTLLLLGSPVPFLHLSRLGADSFDSATAQHIPTDFTAARDNRVRMLSIYHPFDPVAWRFEPILPKVSCAASLPRHCHVIATSLPRHCYVIATASLHRHHAVTTLTRRRRIVTISSPRHRPVVTTPSPCRHHAVDLSSPRHLAAPSPRHGEVTSLTRARPCPRRTASRGKIPSTCRPPCRCRSHAT